jgi:hypothetical protein
MYYVSKRDRVGEEEKRKKWSPIRRERRTSEKVAGLYNKIN